MGPGIMLSHLSMDVCVIVNVFDTGFIFSISFLIFCFSILFLTSKYLIIYCITKDDCSLLDEFEEIYIFHIIYYKSLILQIYIYISYYITKG
jgi:hypothetical protein